MAVKTPRAFLYARVSTKQQAEKNGVALQLREMRDLAEHRGWEILEEFIDEAVSGKTKNRPGLDEMLAKLQKGKCDVVVVWRFDRLARSVSHLIGFLHECEIRNVDFVSVCEGIDTHTPLGKCMFTIAGAMAEMESALARERAQAGIDAARARGTKFGRKARDLTPAQAKDAYDRYGGVRAAARGLTEERNLDKPISAATVSRRLKEYRKMTRS